MKKTMLFMLLLVVVGFAFVACSPSTVDSESTTQDEFNFTSLALACAQANGTWIDSAHECEGLSQETCSSLGGTFKECASACRNNPEAQLCTMQCVLVCEFNDSSAQETVIPQNCTSWFDGCNTCIVANGELGGCTRMACSPDQLEEPRCLSFE